MNKIEDEKNAIWVTLASDNTKIKSILKVDPDKVKAVNNRMGELVFTIGGLTVTMPERLAKQLAVNMADECPDKGWQDVDT